MSDPFGLDWAYWLWIPGFTVLFYTYSFHTQVRFREFHHKHKYLIALIAMIAISLAISYARYRVEGQFADRTEEYARDLQTRLFKPGFLSWFADYNFEHKFRILYPLVVAIIGIITMTDPHDMGIIVSVAATILCLRYISEICKLREFSNSSRYIVLYTFISNATIIINAARALADMFALLLVIMCFYYYFAYLKNGIQRDLLLSWIIMFLAIATRESSAVLPVVLWLVPTKRLDWRQRTILFIIPFVNAFAIFIRFLPWHWILHKLSPVCYRSDIPGYGRGEILGYLICFMEGFIKSHAGVNFLVKWLESLFYHVLIPLFIASFAFPFRDILRKKFKGHADLAWFVVFLVSFFVLRSARIFGRHILPVGWVIYLWVPQGTRRFLERFKLQQNWYWPIIGMIVLSGFLIALGRFAMLYFDLLEYDFLKWIRELHT